MIPVDEPEAAPQQLAAEALALPSSFNAEPR